MCPSWFEYFRIRKGLEVHENNKKILKHEKYLKICKYQKTKFYHISEEPKTP